MQDLRRKRPRGRWMYGMAQSDSKSKPAGPIVLGWREYVAFPQWGIAALLTKIDTGAKTSALHVADVVDRADGVVMFDVVLSRKRPDRTVRVESPKVRTSRVRSSNGQLQNRPVVLAQINIGGITKTIEVSLVERSNMLCRMLLGRTALGPEFLVDAGRTFIHGKLADLKRKAG